MAIEALTHRDDGLPAAPVSEGDWEDWVSASRTRNHVLGDPLLDWLDRYGEERGFQRDTQLAGYDPRTDFTPFIFRQGHRFEEAVIQHLRALRPVLAIATGPEDIRNIAKAEETFAAMAHGVPIIHQGVLWDAEHGTYGAPDLLVRSDVLAELWPEAIDAVEAAVAAPDLGGAFHYRVVDIKFTTLNLLAGGQLGNGGSSPAYKVQLYLYNRALARLQGYLSPQTYLLGRSWRQTVKGVTYRGQSCMERLGPVVHDGVLARNRLIADGAHDACEWIRRVRREGNDWEILPDPSIPELYPNAGNFQDGPWHAAKRQIADDLEDVTLLWQVGRPGREQAHAHGVRRWTDPACTPAVVGVTGDKQPGTLQAILDVNRGDGDPVQPARIAAAEDEWRAAPRLEFYVDFETVSDLADDFTRIPERGGQPLIFMIGCGHIEEGEWRFSCFVTDRIDEECEARIIDEWLAHMDAVRQRLSPAEAPRVIHWSKAEEITFETAYNSATERHPERDWGSPRWFDFLQRVVREEPVVVRGALGFGLKAVAKALHAHGSIQTLWGDGPVDGLGAMVGAWWCHEEAARQGGSMRDLDLMREIVDYNEVDCRVMAEAITYFRERH